MTAHEDLDHALHAAKKTTYRAVSELAAGLGMTPTETAHMIAAIIRDQVQDAHNASPDRFHNALEPDETCAYCGTVRHGCGLDGCHITAAHIGHVPATDIEHGGNPLTNHPDDGHLHNDYGHSRCALCNVLLMPTYRPHRN